jgi:hypothetical protein
MVIDHKKEQYSNRLAKGRIRLQLELSQAWNIYRAAKKEFWELIYDPRYLSGAGKGHVAFLVIWLVAVYFLDLLFGWNVAEYMARQSFHGVVWAIYLATFLFPLAYVAAEIMVNFQTILAKEKAEYFDRDPGKHRTWLAWLCVSLLMAMIMPVAYIATGLTTMASSGNVVFAWLLGGLTLLAFLIHVMLIFSGEEMLAAKHRMLLMISYGRLKGNMQKTYYRLMRSSGNLQSIERDYLRVCNDIGQPPLLEETTPIVVYVNAYIAYDYHHLPYGEEPPMYDPRNLLSAG